MIFYRSGYLKNSISIKMQISFFFHVYGSIPILQKLLYLYLIFFCLENC